MRYAFLILTILLIFGGCGENTQEGNSKKAFAKSIKSLESELFAAEVKDLSKDQKAKSLAAKYKEYVSQFPDDSLSAGYLFKAADLCVGVGEFNKAITHLELLRKNYPKYPRQAESLYLMGFIYDNYLNQKGKAKDKYEEVIYEFPSHQFAKDAQAAINMLGMSNEELIRMFQEKNKSSLDSASSNS